MGMLTQAEQHMKPICPFPSIPPCIAAEYPMLMGLLRHRTHKELAIRIIQTIVEGGTKISSVEKVAMLVCQSMGWEEGVQGGRGWLSGSYRQLWTECGEGGNAVQVGVLGRGWLI